MKIKYKNTKIEIPVKKLSEFGKIIGLMFKNMETESLLFDFNKKTKASIHSFFVFFDFLAIWIDEKNNVLDFQIVKPFSPKIISKKYFTKLIEVPFNSKNTKILHFFVDEKDLNTLRG